jgi:lipopolysaccharide heptosyltransferase II
VKSASDPHQEPQALGRAPWDWAPVRRVLVVRLRSIGDTVLSTPALHALRRFLPAGRIDVLVEEWLGDLLDGHPDVDRVIRLRSRTLRAKWELIRGLRRQRYDVAFDLHGGTTATLLTGLSGGSERVGYQRYQLSALLNRRAPAAATLWGRTNLHSVEEQLGLLGWAGVPVSDGPPTRLVPSPSARALVTEHLEAAGCARESPIALIHPAAAFESKRWSLRGFARVVEDLAERRGLVAVAVAAAHERELLAELQRECRTRLPILFGLRLAEVVALAADARLCVANDSGVAHIAAALRVPTVVVFGSSNVVHWRPWSAAPSAVVRQEVECSPCPGYTCAASPPLACIKRISVEQVLGAIERVLVEAGAASGVVGASTRGMG